MLEIFMLLLDPDPPAPLLWSADAAAAPVTRARRCDDGSSPFLKSGAPNWACEIDGCGPLEPVCWLERVDFCYDEMGEDTGECEWEAPAKCSGLWSCFKLWVGCNGQWECTSGAPCTSGMCHPIPLHEPAPTAPIPGLSCSDRADSVAAKGGG